MTELPKLKFLNFREHAASRTMWLGSMELSFLPIWTLDRSTNKFMKQNVNISEAVLKCFDEIVVNSVDVYVRNINMPTDKGGPVTIIKVWFDTNTGEITVYNDGAGMPVYQVEELENMWSVQGLIAREFSGTNFDDKADPDRVTGGINGLGMKLINANSIKFEAETIDWSRKKYYKQLCQDHMNIINPPTVIDLPNGKGTSKLTASQKTPHTSISFIPDYDKLCRKTKDEESVDWIRDPVNATAMEKCIESRMYQIAAFISSINYRYDQEHRIEYKKKARVFFNDKEIKIKNTNSFAQMFVDESVYVELETPDTAEDDNRIKFPWYISIGLSTSTATGKGGKEKYNFEQVTLVNGIYLQDGGTHVTMLLTKLHKALEAKMTALVNSNKMEVTEAMKNTLKNLLFLVNCRHIPVPSFAGQTKTAIKIGAADQATMRKMYDFPKAFIDKVWNMVKTKFEYICIQKELDSNKKKKKRHIRKYERAEKLGPMSWLGVMEGDSAEQTIADIITHKNSPVSRKKMGTYNIQGVPPNVLKKIKEIKINGETKYLMDGDLKHNIAFNGLCDALELDFSEDYYYSDTNGEIDPDRRAKGDVAFKKLNYGFVLICTDQDLDGIGQICSLILVYFICFFPHLVKRGFVGRLATPIIRVYFKDGTVINFYSEREFDAWVVRTYGSEPGALDRLEDAGGKVSYYKGLAGHTHEEVIKDIGANFLKNVYVYTWDDATRARMDVMYGDETKERKVVLTTPMTHEYSEENMRAQRIPCSDHFDIETKSFQLDFMRRKLKSAIDGLIPSQRKALAGARAMFRNKNEVTQVYQVTGDVTKRMKYQHGEASMNGTIIMMAQIFTGSGHIPVFMPISNGFGGRKNGRSVTGSPRYIKTKYNNKAMDLIFPREDDCLLEYVYEDGKRCEPKYYVPIIPYSILETSTTTGAGWKIDVWARDFKYTMYNLRQMIKFNYPEPAGKPYPMQGKAWIPPGMRVVTGKFTTGSTISEICLGSWNWDADKRIIHVTQLPLKIWSYPFKCHLMGINPANGKTEDLDGNPFPCKDLIDGDIMDNTGNDLNDLKIKLKEGAYETICEQYGNEFISPIEAYLEMSQQMAPHLNMINSEDYITEFKTYESVMEYWFVLRKDLYSARLIRQIILLKLKILYHENMLRFIYMDALGVISLDKDLEEDERIQILENAPNVPIELLREGDKKKCNAKYEIKAFTKFNKTKLFEPGYLKSDKLEYTILAVDSNYNYIDAITIGQKSKKSIAKLESDLQDLRNELEQLENITWKELWISELDKVEKVITEGIRTKWLFGQKPHTFKGANDDEQHSGNGESKSKAKANATKPPKACGKKKKVATEEVEFDEA
jgi:DNA topoisomerase-2